MKQNQGVLTDFQIEQASLTPQQIALLEWMVAPVEERKFATQQELAAHLKVTEQTLCKWKNLPEIKQAVWAASLAWADKKGPQVINKLIQYALQPTGVKDREIFAKYIFPAIINGHMNNNFDVLQPKSQRRDRLDERTAIEIFNKLAPEQKEPFLDAWKLLTNDGLANQEQEGLDHIEVLKNEEDIIDLAPVLLNNPVGRPRGIRKVRIKRRDEFDED